MSTPFDRKAAETRLQMLAPKIAEIFGWAVKSQDPDRLAPWYADLLGPDGEAISLQLCSGANSGKISIGGHTHRINPHGDKVWIPAPLSPCPIRVSLDKGADAIAADIKRRYLPAYMAKLGAMKTTVSEYENAKTSASQRAFALANVIGAPVEGSYAALTVNLYRSRDLKGYGGAKVTLRTDGIRFDGLDVSDETAAEILQVLARAHKAPQD